MNLDGLKVTGSLKWELFRDGQLVESKCIEDIVTDVGLASLATLLNSSAAGNTFVTYMGFGTGTTQEAATDTALEAELTTTNYSGYARPAVTVSNPSSGEIEYVATLTGGTPSGGSVTVTEAGLFNALTGGTLVAHRAGAYSAGPPETGFGSVNLQSASDSLKVTWAITFSS